MIYDKEWLESRIEKMDSGCWEWNRSRRATIKGKKGYGLVGINDPSKHNRTSTGAHRIAWKIFKGPIPEGLMVLHKCDNRPCCNPDHLFLGTNQDNMDDMVKKGRSARTRGEKNGNCKHSKSLIKAAISEYKPKLGIYRSLSQKYGIPYQTLYAAINGRNWKWLRS